MTDTLAEICALKREHIRQAKTQWTESSLRERLGQAVPPRGFHRALRDKRLMGEFALIAEIKKASPSKGIIRADFNPALLAQAYEAGGAACLSVLTDSPYFQGADEYLALARNCVSLPVLRKDFMLDPYQILESRALGADCILLIMAALSDMQARELEDAAIDLGMDVLIEVHNQPELERAALLQSSLIGINNRNLKTLQVNFSTSEALATALPPSITSRDVTLVCESGIAQHEDLLRMQRAGIGCFLVGESLMRQQNVMQATQTLLGICHG